jgi:hypothetical protein
MSRSRATSKQRWIQLCVSAGLLVLSACNDSTAPTPELLDARWALAWAHDPSAASYAVNSSYAYTSDPEKRPVQISRSQRGVYTVRFPGLAAKPDAQQTVHISAYGSDLRRCRVISIANDVADLVVQVQCHDKTGTLADSRFNILLATPAMLKGRSAFATSTSLDGGVIPDSTLFSSAQQNISVARTNVGQYTVKLEGLTRDAVPGSGKEVFHVTSYGEGTAWCKILYWLVESLEDKNLELLVRCYSPEGTPADAQFSILMLERERDEQKRFGYFWLHNVVSMNVTPILSYNFNSTGGVNTVSRISTGFYRATWPELQRVATSTAETNLVTAFGDDATYCQIDSWSMNTTTIRCYAPDGTLTNSQFTAIWIE